MNKTIEFTKENNPIYFVCPYCGNTIQENNLKVNVISDNELDTHIDVSVKCNICGNYMNNTHSNILAETLENFANKGYRVEQASEGYTGYAKYNDIDFPVININTVEKYNIDRNTNEGKFGYININHMKDTLNNVDVNESINSGYDKDEQIFEFRANISTYTSSYEEQIKARDNMLKTMLKFSEELE